MNLVQMEEAGERAARIRELLRQLDNAQHDLKLLNTYKDPSTRPSYHWQQKLVLKSGDRYTSDVSILVEIPFGVAQQQCVYRVEALRREIILLGGSVP